MSETLVEKNSEFLMTETEIKRNVSADQILSILRVAKTNGELRFVLNEGGVRKVSLHEKTKITDAEREEILKILKIQ